MEFMWDNTVNCISSVCDSTVPEKESIERDLSDMKYIIEHELQPKMNSLDRVLVKLQNCRAENEAHIRSMLELPYERYSELDLVAAEAVCKGKITTSESFLGWGGLAIKPLW